MIVAVETHVAWNVPTNAAAADPESTGKEMAPEASAEEPDSVDALDAEPLPEDSEDGVPEAPPTSGPVDGDPPQSSRDPRRTKTRTGPRYVISHSTAERGFDLAGLPFFAATFPPGESGKPGYEMTPPYILRVRRSCIGPESSLANGTHSARGTRIGRLNARKRDAALGEPFAKSPWATSPGPNQARGARADYRG